ncbi:hypothetical protein [Dongshaea marina]|uniref:hypothetical protein n=1 Tax=Dongshaea marina TaxID=2047966 RepID=UPI00131F476B|nr:hypothetical protein [Dongshaea marina]
MESLDNKMHGGFELTTIGSILLTEGYGPWNEKTAEAFCEQMKLKIPEFAGAPWASLIDQRLWELGTPRVWELFDEQLKYMVAHGLACQAILPNSNMYKHMTKQHISRASSDDLKVEYFTDYDEALEWCLTQLKQAKAKN